MSIANGRGDELRPLTPNAGGVVDPDDLVGRTAELAQLHESISVGGAYVTGERRMGKTSLLKRVRRDLEATGVVVLGGNAETRDLAGFEQFLYEQLVRHRLAPRGHAWSKEVEATGRIRIAGSGVSLVYRTRKDAEEVVLDPFQMLADQDRHVVLIIDEVTALCSNLGRDSAADFLAALRRLRENNDRVAIVLSGSVGLHHVVPEAGATRGLIKVGVGPLAESEATELTIRLLRGIGVDAPDPTMVAEILERTSGTPYYIQAVVDALRVLSEPWSIDEVVAAALQTDRWETSHYVDRVPGYFGERDEALVFAILDATAVSNTPLSVEDYLGVALLAGIDPQPSRGQALGLLDRLERDHYLRRTVDNRNMMSTPLMARIWRVHRRLER